MYYFGIIDILTPYNATKKFEHSWKAMRYSGLEISAVPPMVYARRFRNFLRGHVLRVDEEGHLLPEVVDATPALLTVTNADVPKHASFLVRPVSREALGRAPSEVIVSKTAALPVIANPPPPTPPVVSIPKLPNVSTSDPSGQGGKEGERKRQFSIKSIFTRRKSTTV